MPSHRGHSKRVVRNRLMAQNPACTNCGRPLQAVDRHADDYACIVQEAPALACPRCVAVLAGTAAAADLHQPIS